MNIPIRTWLVGFFLAACLSAQGVSGTATNTCAVLEFEVVDDQGLDFNWARMGLADLLQVELQQHNIVTLDRDFVRAIAREQRMARDRSAEGNLALGQCLGARCLVKGSLSATGTKSIRLSVSVVSVPENQVLASVTVVGAFPDELSQMITRLANGVAAGLSGTPGGTGRLPEGGKRYQPSPELQVLFYKGLDLCAQGLPERAVGWFICVGKMDRRFDAAPAWERKAYQMAGFSQFITAKAAGVTNAAVNGSAMHDAKPRSGIRTVAVLDPLVDEHAMSRSFLAKARGLRATTEAALLSLPQVRLFNPASLSSVINELDQQHSSIFAKQANPVYDRWLEVDGMVFCSLYVTNQIQWIQLDILDPISGGVLASRKLSCSDSDLPDFGKVLPEILDDWGKGIPMQGSVSPKMQGSAEKGLPPQLREKFESKYGELGELLHGLRKGEDRYRQLYEAFLKLRREENAAWVMNHILDQAITHRDCAVRIDTLGWALGRSLAPAGKLAHLGDLVVANAPAGSEAAQVWLLRGKHAFRQRDWKVAAACFQEARDIHARIDAPDAMPFDCTIFQWVCVNAMPAYGNSRADSFSYVSTDPAPVVLRQEVPWSLFEPFGDRVVADVPGSLAARCVWNSRGALAFEARDWSNTVMYLERFLDGFTNNPSSTVYLSSSSWEGPLWLASVHYMTAFAAFNLGDLAKARQHMLRLKYWSERGKLDRIDLGINPGFLTLGELSGSSNGPCVGYRVYSRKWRAEHVGDLLQRLEKSGSALGLAKLPADCAASVMMLFTVFQRQDATVEQLESVRLRALALLDVIISTWKPCEVGSSTNGIIADYSCALHLLGIARDIVHTRYPRRIVSEGGPIVAHSSGKFLGGNTYGMAPNGSITNAAAAEVRAAALRAAAAYRAARGFPASDTDLRVPASEVLAYHQNAIAILSMAGITPDPLREFDALLRPPRLSLAVLPEIAAKCGLSADQCERLFRDAVAQEPHPSPSALLGAQGYLAHLFLSERRRDKAMEWYRGAIQTGGIAGLGFDQRADVFRCAAVAAQGDEASRSQKEFIDLVHGSNTGTNDSTAMAWFMAARGCNGDGEVDAALFCYQMARRCAVDKNGWASASYYAAKILVDGGRPEEAAVLWKEIIKELPTARVMLYTEWKPIGGGVHAVNRDIAEEARRFLTAFRNGQLIRKYTLVPASAQGVTGVVHRINPYKVMPAPEPRAHRAREVPPLPRPDPRLAQALTDALTASQSIWLQGGEYMEKLKASTRVKERLAQTTNEFGHAVVPAILSLAQDSHVERYILKNTFIQLLDRTATKADAPFLVAACAKEWWLILIAARLDHEGTAEVVREQWQASGNSRDIDRMFMSEVILARLHAVYPLVLDYIANRGSCYWCPIFDLDRVCKDEKNAEFRAAFRDALGDCVRLMWLENDTYELARISQIALREGVPEIITMLVDSQPPEQCLPQLRRYIDLPAKDDEALAMLNANYGRWQWDSATRRFQLPASGAATK